MATVIIPANPAIYALFPDHEGRLGAPVPVVAWEITLHNNPNSRSEEAIAATPIVPGSLSEISYLLYPDGRVEELECGTWDSLEAANSDEARVERARKR